MAPSRKISTLLCASLAVAAGVLSYLQLRSVPGREPSKSAVQAVVTPQLKVLPAAQPRAVTPPLLASTARDSGVTPRAEAALSKSIQELLPRLEASVSDWKQFKPEKITIAPYPDLAIEFEATSIQDEHGRTVWTGRNAMKGAFLVTAATETDWHATLVIPPAGAFEIHIAGDAVTMLEKNHFDEICGSGGATVVPQPYASKDLFSPAGDAPEAPAVAPAGDSLTTVDVLFFYDALTLAQIQNNPSTFETRMIAHVASSNAALENSQVTNFRWRYLASYPVPAYTTTSEDLSEDLYTITGYSFATKVYSTNPVVEFVTQKAVLHGADQVVLYVAGTRTFGGRAWISSGLSLTFHSAVVVWNSSYMALAHELSHNFGCNHDRETESAPDNNGRYDYGFRYVRAGQDTGTIMSYANFRVPYFSNPQVTFEGVVLGVAEGQPKAANNSRVLRDTASSMIASRVAVEPPAITNQPQSVTVSLGQTFVLNVSASGSSLTYQWKNGSSNIAGATSASFSRTSAVEGDAGSYTVTISNVMGQVTSSPATVTVNPAATVPVTPSTPPIAPVAPTGGGGGGGGGGGAVDPWFAVGGGVLLLLRCLRKKPRT